MSYSFPQYNNFTPLENYKTPYPNIPNQFAGSSHPFGGQQDTMSPSPDSNGSLHSDGMISPSLDPFFQQRPANSPILMQQEHEPMGGNGLLSAYMAAYTKLAESLSLTLDPVGLSTLPPQSLPVMLKAKEISVPFYNCADFPSKFIWTKEDWKKLQEKPLTQLEKLHPLHFVVDKSNRPIPLERVTAICTTSRRVFVDIWNINEAPKSWGAASGFASKLYYQEMVTFFPELGYCDGNWKCNAIATASYTSWRKNHINRLDREGTCKPKAEDIINFDGLKTLDSDDAEGTDTKTNINTKTTKWRTRDLEPLDIRSNSSKKRKSSETSTTESASPSLPVSEVMDSTSQSLVPDGNTPPDSPTSNGRPISTIAEPHTAGSSKETTTSSTPARHTAPADEPITTQPTSEPTPSIVLTPEHSPDCSAIVSDVHTPATIQVAADLMPTPSSEYHHMTGQPTQLQLLPTSTSDTVPPLDASTSKPLNVLAKKSRKMQIGKAQNGHNLCAHEWLTRNKTGSAAEFKIHYDGLPGAQKKSYDELATTKWVNGPVSDITLLLTSCDLAVS
ncbi:hypothetical protein C8R48DRAFT_780465 [Suillus tomentosus]|nr:hypothetical protein C8R48DRAFT_780465 [Suillus tomentosus]